MQYRKFGELDWKASALGFGCLRFPTLSGERYGADIDDAETIRMIRYAIDNGVNYLDTASNYHGGRSETVVAKALQEGYREKVRLATKLRISAVEKASDFDRLLDEQLNRLQTDYIDFYLLHNVHKARWHDVVLKHNLLAKAEAALADGRIRHFGFSIHDDFNVFEEVINSSDLWSFCQIQYNYMDIENQAGTRGLKLAASKGLAVVIMEPLLGGRLVDPPNDVRAAMEAFPVKRSLAEWGLAWLWDQPEVSVVLSGMTNMQQVQENLQYADRSRIHSFSDAEQQLLAQVREMYSTRSVIPCNRCGYCMPCPNGVNIPANLDLYNYAHLFDDLAGARFKYQFYLNLDQRSGCCIECHECEAQCPQKIAISELMPKVSALLA
jgi:hypothetical protein